MKTFKTATYRSQVYQLRQLANNVLKQYDLKVEQLEFLAHGENATFKVITRKGNYLLRIHRDGYHTANGIKEEIRWLNHLHQNGLPVQQPVYSLDKKLLTQGTYKGDHLRRTCTVLTWKEGVFRSNSINETHCKEIGMLLARFHKKENQIPIKDRKYWHADGLLGKDDRFTGLYTIEEGLSKKQYAIFNECRESLLCTLKEYEQKYPEKTGLIHADLHFGNVIWDGKTPVPIDFDDCGTGLHLYDLTINLRSVEKTLVEKKKQKLAPAYLDAMMEGYNKIGNLTQNDIDLLPFMRLARDVTIFAWCYSRKDITDIFEFFNKNRSKKIKKFTKFLKEGPDRFFI